MDARSVIFGVHSPLASSMVISTTVRGSMWVRSNWRVRSSTSRSVNAPGRVSAISVSSSSSELAALSRASSPPRCCTKRVASRTRVRMNSPPAAARARLTVASRSPVSSKRSANTPPETWVAPVTTTTAMPPASSADAIAPAVGGQPDRGQQAQQPRGLGRLRSNRPRLRTQLHRSAGWPLRGGRWHRARVA